jgi:putative phosphoesterase
VSIHLRIAIVSDIHGNLSALEAVLGDLRETSPDVVFHGGDLADGGARPAEVVDRVRELGWRGVIGNTDEMLARPETLADFATQSSPALQPLFAVIKGNAAVAREALGEDRVAWLGSLPQAQIQEEFALLHASPESCWRAPGPEATDAKLESVYKPLGKTLVVYAHIHRPYIRRISGLTIANTGSVSLSYDGDPRASYLLVDESTQRIRRVEYDVAHECKILAESRLPHAGWIAKMLEGGGFVMP